MGTPTIVGQEEAPKFKSLLPVSQSPITYKHIPNIVICIKEYIIGTRAIMTWFWCSLLYWYSMHIKLPNDTSGREAFECWCIDLVMHLKDLAGTATIIVVVVCPFSKWVEAAPLPNCFSSTVAHWLHLEVLC